MIFLSKLTRSNAPLETKITFERVEEADLSEFSGRTEGDLRYELE
ncbi:hypothetical protein [Rhodohalobacter sulfatireducens]|nr:hypothetical protein [Rhodohalobacter sulfatireducens]